MPADNRRCDATIPAAFGTSTENTTYGFVDLEGPDEADRAICDLDRRILNGEYVAVKLSRTPESSSRDARYSGHYNARHYAPSNARLVSREDAHEAAKDRWSRIGLLSTGGGHQIKEEEL